MAFVRKSKRIELEKLEDRSVPAVITVDTLTDDADDAAGVVDGEISLREAIVAANTNAAFGDAPAGDADDDLIQFDPSLADSTVLLTQGSLLITDDVLITGLAEADLSDQSITVSGNDSASVFGVAADVDGQVDFEAMTITAGLGTDGGVSDGTNGGGIFVAGGNDVGLTDVTVSDSKAVNGGGVYVAGDSSLTALGSTFSGNEATGNTPGQGGGAVFGEADTVLDISDSTVSMNLSAADGGGILNNGELLVAGGGFTANEAGRAGGAVENNGGLVDLIGVNVGGPAGADGNTAGVNGGGLHTSGPGDVIVDGGVYANNVALEEGGALWNSAAGILVIQNGTLIDSNTASGAAADQGGGGVFNAGGTLTVDGSTLDVIISNNVADGAAGSGGGVLSDGGTLTVTGAVIDTNTANRAGGGIEVTAANAAPGLTTLTGVTLTGNDVGDAPGNGGGLHITGDADALIDGGTVTGNNAAAEGGGLWNGAGTMTIQNGTSILFNTASGDSADQGGGGVFNNGGTVIIDGSVAEVIILGNVADGAAGSGGGVLSDGGTLTVTAATIDGNTANRAGGGIEVTTVNTPAAPTTLTGVTLSNNSAGVDIGDGATANPGNGGGLHISGDADVTVDGGTVVANVAAAEGGGLWNSVGAMTITGGTIIGGNTASGDAADQGGGGVFNAGGTVDIEAGVVISGNVADGAAGSGGGVLSDGGTLTVTGAVIDTNTANRAGGGIEVTAANAAPGLTTLTGVTLSNNDVGDAPGNGGGLHITGDADALIDGGTVTGNTAGLEGGGLWNGAGTMTVIGTVIDGNTASGDAADDGGGGIFNNGGTVTIDGATISNNVADGAAGSGGGILGFGGTLMIDNAIISGNTANRAGGGIEITTGTVTLTGVTLGGADAADGNDAGAAPGNGGGLHVTGNANVTVTGGTVENNVAGSEGGGLWNSATGTMTLTGGTVIDGNTASGDAADQGGGGLFNDGGTLTVDDIDGPVVLSNNVADGAAGSGGGILSDGGTLTVTAAVIDSNTANRAGGGIEVTAVNNAAGLTTLTGVTLTGNDVGDAPGNGGGLHITGDADALIDGGVVVGNTAAAEGGGLWNSVGTMTITGGTVITGNTASGDDAAMGGGGVFNNGGTVIIDGTVGEILISDNVADGAAGSGGGILSNGGTLTVIDAVIDSNTANRAGGGAEVVDTEALFTDVLFADNDVADGANPGNGGGVHTAGSALVSFTDSDFTGNSAVEGGGLWVGGGSVVDVFDSTFGEGGDGNSATGEGGGVYNAGATLTVSGSLIAFNTAANGGGLGQGDGAIGTTLINTTVSNNTADADGGGIFTDAGSFDLDSVTVEANTATGGTGDGIRVAAGAVNAVNSIVSHSTGGGEDDVDATGGTFTPTASLVQEDDGDPLLQDLADNGGPTLSHAVTFRSPAIDAGDTDEVIDQRGVDRPQGPADDIGAFEFNEDFARLFLPIDLTGGGGEVITVPVLLQTPTGGIDDILASDLAIAFDPDAITFVSGSVRAGDEFDAAGFSVAVNEDTPGILTVSLTDGDGLGLGLGGSVTTPVIFFDVMLAEVDEQTEVPVDLLEDFFNPETNRTTTTNVGTLAGFVDLDPDPVDGPDMTDGLITVDPQNTDPVVGQTDFDVDENTTEVGNLMATDEDGDDLTFTITGDDAALFEVDDEGNITFIDAPDFEMPGDADMDNVYTFDVAVSDGDATVTETVTVNVIDVNEAPVIETTEFTVAERETEVGNVDASDPEGGALTFSLSGDDADLFDIDADGNLTFVEEPDFEMPGDADMDNVYVFQVTATDPTGAQVSASVEVTVTDIQEGLEVIDVDADGGSLEITFSEPFNKEVINIYDRLNGDRGPADLVLENADGMTINGSVVFSDDLTSLTFVPSDGPLPDGVYTLALVSGEDAFQTAAGFLLDGDRDGTPGDDFVTTVTIANGDTPVVGLDEVARGFGQGVSVPVFITEPAGVTRFAFTVTFNPALLTPTGVSLAPGLPAGTSVNVVPLAPGAVRVTVNAPNGLGGATDVAFLNGTVADDAPYTERQLLDVSDVTVNGMEALADDGFHVAAFAGDVLASRTYTGLDAALIQRAAAGIEPGFAAYPLVDPNVIGDVTPDIDTLTGLDAAFVRQAAAGLTVPSIPPIPNLPTPPPDAADPRLYIPEGVTAAPGESVSVPVMMEVTDPAGVDDLLTVELALSFDADVFELEGVRLGSGVAGLTLTSVVVDPATGTLQLRAFGTAGLDFAFGDVTDLAVLDLKVKDDADASEAVINIRESVGATRTALGSTAGFLVLAPAPTDADTDDGDGVVTIQSPLLSFDGFAVE